MIVINESKDCCGCNACAQRCPKHCITLQEDHEGFLYPKVDTNLCIECGLCEKVCPTINPGIEKEPLEVYAAINPNESIRAESSSGGIFSLLAKKIIQENGIIFGARFNDNWEVIHDYTETLEGLTAFRGSKYVQSQIGNNFQKAETFLKTGRKVLFSGTPCQIAGLKRYLRKEYDNLITVDFICHGVPSPKVWRTYLNEICENLVLETKNASFLTNKEKKSYIRSINFRDKNLGWKNFSFSLKMCSTSTQDSEKSVELCEPFYKNSFMKGFLNDLTLRPSCYQCPCKPNKYKSDFTIADFWGIQYLLPDMDDDKGTSLIFINTNQGKLIYDKLIINSKQISYTDVLPYNKGLNPILNIPTARKKFFDSLNTRQSICTIIEKAVIPSFIKRIKQRIKKFLRF